MMGIGGTGVVTVNQVLGMAALIDGLHVSGLDQTGLSQKGGPVVSDLQITREPLPCAPQGAGRLASTSTSASTCSAPPSDANLVTAAPDRTAAVVSTSAVPTGPHGGRLDERFPELASQLDRIEARHARGAQPLPRRPARCPSGCSATT